MFQFLNKHKFVSDSLYPYHEFAKENQDTTYCIISRLPAKYVEGGNKWMTYDYKPETLVIDDDPDEKYGIPFVSLSYALALLEYGNTYNELSFAKKDIRQIPKKELVKRTGNVFHEYKAKQLYVKRQVSLSDVNMHMFLIQKATPDMVKRMLIRGHEFNSIENNMKRFGFKEAEDYWHNISQQFFALPSASLYKEFAMDLKLHPEKYLT